jgi:hypothetical protein
MRKNTTGRRPKQGGSSRGETATKTSTSSDTSKETNQKQRESRFPTTPRGYDKLVAPYNEPPILVPAAPHNKTYTLPTIHVDALLDPKTYCRRTAFLGGAPTKNGVAAMKRLLQGKNHALKVLRREVHRGSSRNRLPNAYACFGHGVPHQLLQDHINLAESLLSYHDGAAEISCRNMHGNVSFDW